MQDAMQKLQLPHLIANNVCRSLHEEFEDKASFHSIQECM